jgi:hypothetical protein
MGVKIGGIAFIVGLVLAVIVAIMGANNASWAIYVLAVLGLIVGLMNVTEKESLKFLVASIAFITTFTALGTVVAPLGTVGDFLSNFFGLLVVFVSPAAAIVAISSLLAITKD